jgi:hypothetical protein
VHEPQIETGQPSRTRKVLGEAPLRGLLDIGDIKLGRIHRPRSAAVLTCLPTFSTEGVQTGGKV